MSAIQMIAISSSALLIYLSFRFYQQNKDDRFPGIGLKDVELLIVSICVGMIGTISSLLIVFVVHFLISAALGQFN